MINATTTLDDIAVLYRRYGITGVFMYASSRSPYTTHISTAYADAIGSGATIAEALNAAFAKLPPPKETP